MLKFPARVADRQSLTQILALFRQLEAPKPGRRVYFALSARGPTVRISCSKQFILLHVPRTGVSSIIRALDDELFVRTSPSAMNKLMSKFLFSVPRPVEKTYFRTHETASHVRRLLPAAMFDNYCKIAFVRNPFSWLVSLYELVLQSPNHRHFNAVSAMDGFADYVAWEITRNKRMQWPYLYDRSDRLLVDRVGRIEHLADDAVQIFGSLGVDLQPLPWVGQRTRKNYREFYDRETLHRVAANWARDLEVFGYDFDGPIGGLDQRPPSAG